jgi:hypothetical protein
LKQDLELTQNYFYFTNHQNYCSSSPCPYNATCQGDFPSDPVPYRCICPAGFSGENCLGKIYLFNLTYIKTIKVYFIVIELTINMTFHQLKSMKVKYNQSIKINYNQSPSPVPALPQSPCPALPQSPFPGPSPALPQST